MLVLEGHTDTVRSVAYAPDGLTLASCGQDRTVRLWDLATRHPRLTWGDAWRVSPLGPDGPISYETTSYEAVAFAPDGEMLAVGRADGGLQFFRPGDKEFSLFLGPYHSQGIRALTFAPDGRTLVSASWDGRAILWTPVRVGHRTNKTRPRVTLEAGSPVTALAYAPDGKRFALGLYDGTIWVCQPMTGQKVAEVSAGRDGVFALAFAPDGRTLASADGSGTICLWDVAKKKRERAKWRGHDRVVYALAFTPDGAVLASGGADAAVKLWDVASARGRAAYRWQASWVTSLAFAPDGMTAAAGGADHTVVVWDVDSA